MTRSRWIAGVAVVLAGLLVAVAGCGDDSGSQSVSGPASTAAQAGGGPIEGGWSLDRYTVDGAMQAPPSDVSIDADFSNGRVSGNAGVNTYSGTYAAGDTGSLQIGPLVSTQMAGPPAAMAAEGAYLDALERAGAYTSDGVTLTVSATNGDPLLEYAREESTLEGAWEVTGFNNGKEAVVSLVAGSTITAEFGADGSLAGDAGVNRYTTTYRTSAGSGGATGITVSPAAATRMAGDPALMEQEQQYLQALESAATFTIQGKVLTLRDGDDAIAVTLTRS